MEENNKNSKKIAIVLLLILGIMLTIIAVKLKEKTPESNNEQSCKILNSEIAKSGLVSKNNCYFLNKTKNQEKVKGEYKYGQTQSSSGTGFMVCEINYDDNKKVVDKKCSINSN